MINKIRISKHRSCVPFNTRLVRDTFFIATTIATASVNFARIQNVEGLCGHLANNVETTMDIPTGTASRFDAGDNAIGDAARHVGFATTATLEKIIRFRTKLI